MKKGLRLKCFSREKQGEYKPMYKIGMTIFEVLLYVGLLSVLLGIVSGISIQSFKMLSSARFESSMFRINYYIERYIKYFADTAEQVSVSTNTDSLIFSYKNSSERVLTLSSFQKIVGSISNIQNIHFVYDPILKICTVTYTVGTELCAPRVGGENCEQHLEINLL